MAEAADGRSVAFNHIGIGVTDLERSRRFYEEALDFQYWWEMPVPDEPTSRLLQLPAPLGVRAMYLTRDDFVLELMYFAHSRSGPSHPRVMNEPGLTHLSVAVADIAATLEKVEPNGGEILRDTDMGGMAIMIRDPDGQLIELTTFRFPDMRPPRPDRPPPS